MFFSNGNDWIEVLHSFGGIFASRRGRIILEGLGKSNKFCQKSRDIYDNGKTRNIWSLENQMEGEGEVEGYYNNFQILKSHCKKGTGQSVLCLWCTEQTVIFPNYRTGDLG